MADSLSELYQVVTTQSQFLQRVLVLVAILLCCAPILAQEKPTSRELELRVIETLARGQDATPLLDRWLALATPEPSGIAPRPLSQSAQELHDALAALEGLATKKAKPTDELLDAWDAVRAADLLVRQHFRAVAERLDAAGDAWVEVATPGTGEVLGRSAGSSRSGEGKMTLSPSIPLDIDIVHEVQLVLNQGTPAEVRSDPVELPLAQKIVRRVDSSDKFFKEGSSSRPSRSGG